MLAQHSCKRCRRRRRHWLWWRVVLGGHRRLVYDRFAREPCRHRHSDGLVATRGDARTSVSFVQMLNKYRAIPIVGPGFASGGGRGFVSAIGSDLVRTRQPMSNSPVVGKGSSNRLFRFESKSSVALLAPVSGNYYLCMRPEGLWSLHRRYCGNGFDAYSALFGKFDIDPATAIRPREEEHYVFLARISLNGDRSLRKQGTESTVGKVFVNPRLNLSSNQFWSFNALGLRNVQ